MHILDNNVTSGYSFYRIDFKRFYFVHILMSSVGLRKFTRYGGAELKVNTLLDFFRRAQGKLNRKLFCI